MAPETSIWTIGTRGLVVVARAGEPIQVGMVDGVGLSVTPESAAELADVLPHAIKVAMS